MMKFLTRLALVSLLAARPAAAEDVSILLEPSADGTVYYKESLEAVNKRNPTPYPPGQDVTEWMQLEYPGTYVGHVKPSFVNEDMTVANGAPIHLRPQESSPVLATVDGSFTPQVIELGPNWATVFYEGDATAYFRWPSRRPEPMPVSEMVTVTSAPAEGGEIVAVSESEEILAPAAAEPVAKKASQAPASGPVAVAQSSETKASPAPSPKPAPAPVASDPPELEPMAAAPRRTLPTSPPPPPFTSEQVTRVWEGKLVRNRGLSKLFGKDYPYYLENAAGDRIAYVDFSEALLFQPIENYWDANVIINGTAEKLVDSTPVLIKVRVIRPAF